MTCITRARIAFAGMICFALTATHSRKRGIQSGLPPARQGYRMWSGHNPTSPKKGEVDDRRSSGGGLLANAFAKVDPSPARQTRADPPLSGEGEAHAVAPVRAGTSGKKENGGKMKTLLMLIGL